MLGRRGSLPADTGRVTVAIYTRPVLAGDAWVTFFKYTTAVNVFSSSNTWYALASFAIWVTVQFSSAASPKTIALDGHEAAHAVVNSSGLSGRFSSVARFSA